MIEGLHRDIAALHKEVANRDDAIAEKEKRILDLKGKTQVGLDRHFVQGLGSGERPVHLSPWQFRTSHCPAVEIRGCS